MRLVRRHALYLILLGVAVSLILNVYDLAKLHSSVASQLSNRTHNVYVWCDAINSTRDYNRAFVTRVTRGHVLYGLADLNCRKLATTTRKSAK